MNINQMEVIADLNNLTFGLAMRCWATDSSVLSSQSKVFSSERPAKVSGYRCERFTDTAFANDDVEP